MYIDPWQWYRDFQLQALRTGNTSHLRLPQVYQRGWNHLENARYDESIQVFSEGVELAKSMQMPVWEFFFESWVCEVHVLASNYTSALDAATRLVASSVRPEHREHPCRAVVYFTLAWVYYYIDVHGYENEILQALDTLETDMPLDEETHQRSIFLRAEIAFEKEDYRQARIFNDRYMNLVDGNAFRESSGYGMQRELAYTTGDLPAALSATRLREATARKARLLKNAANSALWEAVLLRHQGEEGKAEAAIQRGMNEYDALNLPKQASYYRILAEYQAAKGDFEASLKIRDTGLQKAIESGSLSSEFHCRLDRCYLINKLGRDVSEELAAAEKAAHRSKKPDFLLKKLNAVRDGRTVRYDWQAS